MRYGSATRAFDVASADGLLDESDEVEPSAQVLDVAREDAVQQRADDEEDPVVGLGGRVEVGEGRAELRVGEEEVDLRLEELLEGLADVSLARRCAREHRPERSAWHARRSRSPRRPLVARIEREPEQRVHGAADAHGLRRRRLVPRAAVVEQLEHRVRERDRGRRARRPAACRRAPDRATTSFGVGRASANAGTRVQVRPGLIPAWSSDPPTIALPPRGRALGLDAVLFGESLDRLAVERFSSIMSVSVVERLGPRAVLHFEAVQSRSTFSMCSSESAPSRP